MNLFIYTCSPDKNKATVQILRDHSDVWHTGKESIDVRIARKTFARVQEYFPECSIMVEDLEAHVQAAEARMFPQKKAEQEAWLQAVVQSVIPKVYVARGRVSLFTTMSRNIPFSCL